MTEDVGAAVSPRPRRVVSLLIGMTGNWDLAGECAQDGLAQAPRSWPHDGVPRRPGGWLTTVARNRVTDRLRRRAAEAARRAAREQAIIGYGRGKRG